MTRLLSGLGLAIALPAMAAAQTPPPPPPPTPPVVPPVAPAPPAPPPTWIAPDLVRPMAPMAPAAIDAMRQADQAVRLAAEWDIDSWRLRPWQTAVAAGRESDYNSGLNLLQRRDYEQAITRFDRAITRETANVDGALYWKAFAQYKLGRIDEALASLATLRQSHAQSRYLGDAKALEADVRRLAGQRLTPEAIANLDDDDIKLLAITGIQQADPEGAIPLLEGVLQATNSLAVKRRALYVLALSSQPRAYQVLLSYARGAGNPDLQVEAIRYVAVKREPDTSAADLRQIYESATDRAVKLAVIDAYRSGTARVMSGVSYAPRGGTFVSGSGAGGRGTTVTSFERAVIASTAAGRGGPLAASGRPQDLWLLYQKESDAELRMHMVNAFASMSAVDQLRQVIQTERDSDVRLRAIRSLGNRSSDETSKVLVDLYGTDTTEETRRVVIGALASQNNAEALVAIARKETSTRLKTEIVRHLSNMASRSKVAADYLLEIIK